MRKNLKLIGNFFALLMILSFTSCSYIEKKNFLSEYENFVVSVEVMVANKDSNSLASVENEENEFEKRFAEFSSKTNFSNDDMRKYRNLSSRYTSAKNALYKMKLKNDVSDTATAIIDGLKSLF